MAAQPADGALARHVDTGGAHTCALTSEGKVECWGENTYGQLGNGSTTSSSVPVATSNLPSDVADVSAGDFHTCARTDQGALKCWGANFDGQLGNGLLTNSSTPVNVVDLQSGVVEVAMGARHTCARTSAGQVKCWGANDLAQLGIGTMGAGSKTPVLVKGLENDVVVELSAAGDQSCVRTAGGVVKCWGYTYSALGNFSATPVAVPGLGTEIVELAAGGYHVCARTNLGGVKCWGYNYYGQVGDGTNTDRRTPVAVVDLPSDVVEISAGIHHTCARTSQGIVACWGQNLVGQLGNDSVANSSRPVLVTGLPSDVVEVSAGGRGVYYQTESPGHTCARTGQGALRCWGGNAYGKLGNDYRAVNPTAVDVTKFWGDVAELSLGLFYSCARTSGGAVLCSGHNRVGQLGNGTTKDSFTPVPVTNLQSGVVELAMGSDHACARTNPIGAGPVKCWGRNTWGQLGNGTRVDSAIPVVVSGLPDDVVEITAGAAHMCARTSQGKVYCWGYNFDGQLGNGTYSNSSVPVLVRDLPSDVAEVAAGGNHTCARTNLGAASCWGDNNYGALGNGSYASSTVPVSVTNLQSGVVELSLGYDHSCARTSQGPGAISCWGRYLLNGSNAHRTTPVLVLSGEMAALAAGGSSVYESGHHCARTNQSAVKCWGYNTYGQLGNPSARDSWSPVDAVGLSSDVIALSLGGYHGCARTSRGTVECWGANGWGNFGNGFAGYSPVPVKVVGFEGSAGFCGDGALDPGEQCDDGNAASGDCCTPTCQLDAGQPDPDGDGICSGDDDCPTTYNPDQRDSDAIGGGDLCDVCPADATDRCAAAKTAAATIDETGGTLEVPDQTVMLDVPAGALEGPTSISVTGPLPGSSYGLKIGDKTPLLFQLEPSGTPFDPAIGITLRWKDANDNCFVDNPATPCSAQSGTGCTGDRDPDCDLPVREEKLQIFRNGAPYPEVSSTCADDESCDRAANAWTIVVPEFSEYVLGEATCATVRKRELTLTELARPLGNETLRFRGQVNLEVPVEPAIDPLTSGIALVVRKSTGQVVYETRLEAEPYDASTQRGWKKRPSRKVWTYARDDADGSITAKVSVAGANAQRVKFDVKAAALRLPRLTDDDLPLTARFLLDGRCGDAPFTGPSTICTFSADRGSLECD